MTLGSCNRMTNDEGNDEGIILSTRIKIIIADQELHDRLSPESPSYFGETYAEGIEVLHLYKGEKFTTIELRQFETGKVYFPEDDVVIQPPFRETADYGAINQNTFGYYFWDAYPRVWTAVDDICYTYIRYPDGSEDEIKVLLLRFGEHKTSIRMEKIWINGELAYAMSENTALSLREGTLPQTIDTSNPDNFKAYYNPQNYPWLEPLLDDNGIQMGTCVRPQYGSDAIVIIRL